MHFTKKPYTGYILLTALFTGILSGCKQKEEQNKDVVRSVKTITVTSASTTSSRQLSGILKASDESDLSFQVSGTVDSVPARLGDTVKKVRF